MLKKLTDKKKIIFIIIAVVFCIAVGILIFKSTKPNSTSKKKNEQIEQQDLSKEDGEDSTSEKPYAGDGLDVTDEKEDTVEKVPWSDSENSDQGETDGQENTPSVQPEQEDKQDSEQDTEGDLEEGILDDGKEWGNNIS